MTGAITYAVTSANGTGCSVNSSTGAVTGINSVGTGPCVVTASVAASGNYAAGSSTLSITVNKATPTVTFTNGTGGSPPSQTASVTYPASTFSAVATATSGDGRDHLRGDQRQRHRLQRQLLHRRGPGINSVGTGSCVVTASVAASGNYAAGSSTLSITVNKATPTVTFTNGTGGSPPSQTAKVPLGGTFSAVATATSGDAARSPTR